LKKGGPYFDGITKTIVLENLQEILKQKQNDAEVNSKADWLSITHFVHKK